jgi:hypothetical protein
MCLPSVTRPAWIDASPLATTSPHKQLQNQSQQRLMIRRVNKLHRIYPAFGMNASGL